MTSYIKGYYSKSIYQNGTGYNIGILELVILMMKV